MRARLLTLAAAVGAAAVLQLPTAAEAAPRVSVANPQGQAVADVKYNTKVTVRGSGFQSIKGGHGGIYVFFGTVKNGWKPSQGGKVGSDYRYVPDSESKNNQGFQKFVTFPGGDTASAANGGTLAANGTWSTTMNIPGATFTSVDRNGRPSKVDCRKVTCGIITIGAHGVVNARNESFTPVRFDSLYDKAPASQGGSAASGAGGSSGSTSGDSPKTTKKPTARGSVAAAVDRATAVRGRVLSFSGTGFTPGEQVSATLDDGLAAVGPLSAGPNGEIAGVLQLPTNLEVGTHVLRLAAAGSGRTANVSFAVRDETALSSADSGTDVPWLPIAFVGLGLVALIGSILFALLRLRGSRKGVNVSAT